MHFGDNVRAAREKQGITQCELSQAVGVKQATFAQYETGAKAPTVYVAVKIAKILHTTVEALATGSTN